MSELPSVARADSSAMARSLTDRVLARVNDAALVIDPRSRTARAKSAPNLPASTIRWPHADGRARAARHRALRQRVFLDLGTSYRAVSQAHRRAGVRGCARRGRPVPARAQRHRADLGRGLAGRARHPALVGHALLEPRAPMLLLALVLVTAPYPTRPRPTTRSCATSRWRRAKAAAHDLGRHRPPARAHSRHLRRRLRVPDASPARSRRAATARSSSSPSATAGRPIRKMRTIRSRPRPPG